jgi:hypothetical protein
VKDAITAQSGYYYFIIITITNQKYICKINKPQLNVLGKPFLFLFISFTFSIWTSIKVSKERKGLKLKLRHPHSNSDPTYGGIKSSPSP